MWSHNTSGSDLTLQLKIIGAGYVIEAEDKRMLTEEQVRDFYSGIAYQVRKLKKKKIATMFSDAVDSYNFYTFVIGKEVNKYDQPNKLPVSLLVSTWWRCQSCDSGAVSRISSDSRAEVDVLMCSFGEKTALCYVL